MLNSLPGNAGRPSPGSALAKWLDRRRRHPDAFVCGVRVVAGELPGERAKWRYANGGVDPLPDDGVYTLNREGGPSLRLRITKASEIEDAPRPRAGLSVLAATEVDHDARVLLAVPPGELVRLGVDVL